MPFFAFYRSAGYTLPFLLCLSVVITVLPAATGKTSLPSPPPGMVAIPAGQFTMGSDYGMFEDTRPLHKVTLSGFFMDKGPVTNAQFARFIKATGYQTVAERKPDPKLFPGVPADKLVPG